VTTYVEPLEGSGSAVQHAFLIHREGDHVGVAVREIVQGEAVEGFAMDTGARVRVAARQNIPLGHKIALRDLRAGEQVIEYAVPIGLAKADITAGDWVHVHNIRSARW
jgi:(2R)-sulfolactate sulfo-lyase subunit alpha